MRPDVLPFEGVVERLDVAILLRDVYPECNKMFIRLRKFSHDLAAVKGRCLKGVLGGAPGRRRRLRKRAFFWLWFC